MHFYRKTNSENGFCNSRTVLQKTYIFYRKINSGQKKGKLFAVLQKKVHFCRTVHFSIENPILCTGSDIYKTRHFFLAGGTIFDGLAHSDSQDSSQWHKIYRIQLRYYCMIIDIVSIIRNFEITNYNNLYFNSNSFYFNSF